MRVLNNYLNQQLQCKKNKTKRDMKLMDWLSPIFHKGKLLEVVLTLF